MKKRNVVLLVLLTAIAVLGALGYAMYERSISSPQYPVISFAEKTLNLSVNADTAELLRGVTAVDPEDGDVTQSLVVQGMSNVTNGNSVQVTYAAFDSRNHVSKAERTVKFTDYDGPKFRLNEPLIFTKNDSKWLSKVGADDPFDGDISCRVKFSIVTNEISLSDTGDYEVKFMVTNRIGDTESIVLPVEIVSKSVNTAGIELTDYLVYLSVGDEFAPEDYVVGYTADDGPREGAKGLTVKSDVDMSEPGVYAVNYIYDGKIESRTRLIAVVE